MNSQKVTGNKESLMRHYFEQAVENYPSFEEAHVGLAATLLAQQHPELALAQLQKAVELRPDDPVAWYRLSQVQRRLEMQRNRDTRSRSLPACTHREHRKLRAPKRK